ncbi:hypothetical protein F5887DRAFT_428761 [Amanita rubescens]|nr:hypothetical protein F5887DRAFT_428761 [Amanita rubescens]
MSPGSEPVRLGLPRFRTRKGIKPLMLAPEGFRFLCPPQTSHLPLCNQMKFSSTILIALFCASATLAVPSSFQTEERGDEVCWRVCFPARPHCPIGTHPRNFGECWTCCSDISVDGE